MHEILKILLLSCLMFHCLFAVKIIGLVPARNEEAIIEQCLRCLSLYTDAIVYLDDASTDGTLSVVKKIADECHVERIITKDHWYRDEPGDRNKLLSAGRNIRGTHFVILDADEIFAATCLDQDVLRQKIIALKPGERLNLPWINLWKSTQWYRVINEPSGNLNSFGHHDFAFCDNRRCYYRSRFIHTSRVPNMSLPGRRYIISDLDCGVLHFQWVNMQNRQIKKAWYLCLEHMRDPKMASVLRQQRVYTFGEKLSKGDWIEKTRDNWFSGYKFFDCSIYLKPDNWRLQQIKGWVEQFGRNYFKQSGILAIPVVKRTLEKDSLCAG